MEKHSLKEFEKRVFRVTFLPTTGEWTRLLKASSIVQLTSYISGDKMKENGTDGACGTYGGEERYMQGFDGEA
jgi:hypothetical protein